MQKFFTATTAATKEVKRRKIVDILEGLAETPFPLTVEVLTELGAVLDAAEVRAGDQYLHEAKLLHVELDYPWSDSLDARLRACKRALRRDQGPEVRAQEVKIDLIPTPTWEVETLRPKRPKRPVWSFAWATVWMLRAIEAAATKVGHVKLHMKSRTVALWIPRSKMDQEAKGVTRTLSCCGEAECLRSCPFALATRALAESPNARAEDPLFPSQDGSTVSKELMVKSWMEQLGAGVSGHSARRSGAMMYTRRGMAVTDISFLGRWKSSAVFRYVEDALELMPLNEKKRCTPRDVANPEAEPERPAARQQSTRAPLTETRNIEKKPKASWAISLARRQKTAHRIGEASWDIQLDEWATICGWHFARKNVKVSIAAKVPTQIAKCRKCEEIWALRDGVLKAREWAQGLEP